MPSLWLGDPNCADLLKAHRQLRDLQLLLQENATLIAQKRRLSARQFATISSVSPLGLHEAGF